MFGHLVVKSAYSFQNSTILIPDLIKAAKARHLDVLALTDENNMYGTFEFYEACKKAGIKPIFGVEASININHEIYPFTLLAKDDHGYFDLVRIVSDINLSKSRSLPIRDLARYNEHLIIMIASDEGIVQRLILKEMEKEAEKYLRFFKDIFKNFYVCLCDHELALGDMMNKRLETLANLVHIPIVCANDVSYLNPQDALALDLLRASAKGETLSPNHQPKTTACYLKSEEEMMRSFSPEIIENTKELLNLCKASIPENNKNLPNYPVAEHVQKDLYLRKLCQVGLSKRFLHKQVPQKYIDRLNYELQIIHMMGFDDYFLIVWDYVRYAKVHGILVGPGRGSAAGSLVAYVLGITNIDPLKYDLLFERFLNPERVSMPDIDIDFEDDRRDEVVNYVIEKYGQDHVCQIVTFNTYGPRVALKDMGKVMDLPLPRLEMIAKMIPTGPKNKKTITEMYNTSASFQKAINENQTLRKIIGAISIIEHLPRNISMHAAGVVLSTRPLRESVPLVIGPSSMIMSQYSKDYIEKAGLLKMDFLGLRNLTMMAYIKKDIETHQHRTIDLNHLPLDDVKTYQMLSRADTFGVFQLESAGMRHLLRRMKPHAFNDIVDAIALYRPGPMENIPLYLERRQSHHVTYLVPALEPILSSTYGIIIYQEQIMQIAQVIAGFSLGKADVLRKAVSKKNAKTMAEMKEAFIQGSLKQGYSLKIATQIYDLIEKFANYGFNKSHSVAYAFVAYQLAYLKVHAPLYFFASILSNEGASANTKIHCIEEAKRYHVKILPPSINRSLNRFTVEEGGIRFALTSIKNVGYSGYKDIAKEREEHGPFNDFVDFLGRMSGRLNSKMIDSLISAGAFDDFGMSRAMLKGNLATLVEFSRLKMALAEVETPVLKDYEENRYQRLEEEKDVLGIYLSTHPMAYKKQKIAIPLTNLSDLEEHVNEVVDVMMMIDHVRVIVDKRAREMAFVEGSDDTSSQDFVIFASQYSTYKNSLERGKVIVANVRISMRDRLSLIINKVKEINEWKN